MLSLLEAQDYLSSLNERLCSDDQFCAVSGRDWVQVGTSVHANGASHVYNIGGYPPWGDNPTDTTYGLPTWNYSILYR